MSLCIRNTPFYCGSDVLLHICIGSACFTVDIKVSGTVVTDYIAEVREAEAGDETTYAANR